MFATGIGLRVNSLLAGRLTTAVAKEKSLYGRSCSSNLEPLLAGCVTLINTSTISVFSFLVCLPLLVIHRYVMLSRAYVNSVADSTLEMKPVEKQVHKAFRGRDGLLQHLLF